MSDKKIYYAPYFSTDPIPGGHPIVSANDWLDSQLQLAALREELAECKRDRDREQRAAIEANKELKAAGQRNVQELRQAYELGYIDGCRTPDEIRSDKEVREERLKYMLARAQPTESGASE